MIPLSLAKAQLNIVDNSDDALIKQYIAAAQEHIEATLQLKIVDEEVLADGQISPNAALKSAALIFVSYMYENRGDGTKQNPDLPEAFYNLIQRYRLMGV